MSDMEKNKYYAVTTGRFPGIYTTLHEAETVNCNVVRNIQEFSTMDDANTYMMNNSIFTAVENDIITVLAGVNECSSYVQKNPNAHFVGRSAEKTRAYVAKKPLYSGNPVMLQMILADIDAAEAKLRNLSGDMGISQAKTLTESASDSMDNSAVKNIFAENVFTMKIMNNYKGRIMPSLPLYSTPEIWKNYSEVNRGVFYVFTDGSATEDAISSAYIAVFNGNISSGVASWENPASLTKGAAVAENAAIIMALSRAIKLHARKAVIVHDGTHQEYVLFSDCSSAKQMHNVKYRELIEKMSEKIKIEFALIKGHSSSAMHNAVDKLASARVQTVYAK